MEGLRRKVLFVSLPGRPHAAFPAQTVPYSEDIGDVDPTVGQTQKYGQGLKILANSIRSIIDMKRRKLDVILLHVFR